MLNLTKVEHKVEEQLDLEDDTIVVLKLVSGETVVSFANVHEYAYELSSPLVYEYGRIDSDDSFAAPDIYFDAYTPGVQADTYWVIARHVIHAFDEDQVDPKLISAYLRRVENHGHTIH